MLQNGNIASLTASDAGHAFFGNILIQSSAAITKNGGDGTSQPHNAGTGGINDEDEFNMLNWLNPKKCNEYKANKDLDLPCVKKKLIQNRRINIYSDLHIIIIFADKLFL